MQRLRTIVTAFILIGSLVFVNQLTYAAGEAELQLHQTLDTQQVSKTLFSPDGSLLFTAESSHSRLWYVDNGTSTTLDKLSPDQINDAAFSPDSSILAVASRYSGLNLYDSRSGNWLVNIQKHDSLWGPEKMEAETVAFSADGKSLIAGLLWDGIYILDAANYQELRSFPSGDAIKQIRAHTTKNEFAVLTYRNSDYLHHLNLQVRDLSNGNIIKSLGSIVTNVQQIDYFDFNYSPDGKYLVFTYKTYDQFETFVFDAANNYQKIAIIPAYGGISFTPDSSMVIIGNTACLLDQGWDGLFDIKAKNSDEILQPTMTYLSPNGTYLSTRLIANQYDSIYAKVSLLDASALGERLTAIRIEPDPIVMEPNKKINVKLTGIYSNGTQQSLDASKANFTTSDFYIAKSDGNSLQALGYGTTTLTATYGNLSTSAQVTVAASPARLQGQLNDTHAKFQWEAVSDNKNLIGYYMYRRALDDSYGNTPLTDFPLQATTYTDSTIETGQDYYYAVKAVYKGGIESGLSNEVLISSRFKQIVLQVNNPYMTVNGVTKEIDAGNGTAPIIQKGRTILPIRAVIEEMGGTLEWLEQERKIIIELNGLTVELQIDNNKAMVNGVERILDVAPVIINKRTMIPLRFVSENLGLDLDWNGETRTITLVNFD